MTQMQMQMQIQTVREYETITRKQRLSITKIELYLGKEFEGTTRQEASDFIGKYINESKEIEEEDRILSIIQYEEYGFI